MVFSPGNLLDVAIIGAGPAGLAAATSLLARGYNVRLFESGAVSARRHRHRPVDVVSGVGGAGLYSDGKFSFYPSATKLWELDRGELSAAYEWLRGLLDDVIKVPPFPEDVGPAGQQVEDFHSEKVYASVAVDFDTRLRLIQKFESEVGVSLSAAAQIRAVHLIDGDVALDVTERGEERRYIAKTAIVAGGRFGALSLPALRKSLPHVFKRYEFGVRLEAFAESFFLKDHPCLDPKLAWREESAIEWRTFCTCRNGDVVETDFMGVVSFSGRSDVERTHFSNLGFNVRFTEEPLANSALAQEAENCLRGLVHPFKAGLKDYMDGRVDAYGPYIDETLRAGLTKMQLGAEVEQFVIVGPCIEGVGYYPMLDHSLRSPVGPIWFAGDQSGIFRGLTAAFVSGRYVGRHVEQYLLTTPCAPTSGKVVSGSR